MARLRALAGGARFVDGRQSNPHSTVKNNLQIDLGDPAHGEAARLMGEALQRSEPFRNFAMAKVIAPPLLAKYIPGMNYGVHSDASFLPLANRALRSDLSCTIFIAEPARPIKAANCRSIWGPARSSSKAAPAARSSIRPTPCIRSIR